MSEGARELFGLCYGCTITLGPVGGLLKVLLNTHVVVADA